MPVPDILTMLHQENTTLQKIIARQQERILELEQALEVRPNIPLPPDLSSADAQDLLSEVQKLRKIVREQDAILRDNQRRGRSPLMRGN